MAGTAEVRLGLIDTLTAGFRLVQRRCWLLLAPVLLDIWLWQGPQLSIKPLTQGVLRLWAPDNLPAELASLADTYRPVLIEAGDRFNLLWLLSNGLTWLHSLLPGLVEPAGLTRTASQIEVPPLALLVWTPLILIAGLGIGSLFLTSTASQTHVDEDKENPRLWLRRGLRTWLALLIYGALLLALLLAVTVALSLLFSVIMLIAPGLGGGLATLGFLLGGWVVVWAYLMLYFVVAAVVTQGASLPEALWRSVNVVARNFWGTIGLVVLTNVLLSGFGFVWQRLADLGSWGLLAAIAGNAFLFTSLAAARLLFYQDRFARWQETLALQAAPGS